MLKLNLNRNFWIVFLLFVMHGPIRGQGIEQLKQNELQLKILADSMVSGSTQVVRDTALLHFSDLLEESLEIPGAFTFPFDSVKVLSKLTADDGVLRFYTWLMPNMVDKQYKFYGLVQVRQEDGKYKLLTLADGMISQDLAEGKKLGAGNWFGAVYYDLFRKRYKKEDLYYLLGWRGNDVHTTSKVIEVVKLNKDGTLTFGLPVFDGPENKVRTRVVFSYSSSAVMVLRHEARKKRIVFDHLSPDPGALVGDYRHYGPDFTYDGFRYKKGHWSYVKGLDLRNKAE